MLIRLKNIEKTYDSGGSQRDSVLENLDFSLEEGEMVAILGKSGSGKSTLLRIIGLLESPNKGDYLWKNKDIIKMKNKWNKLRNQEIGFIMQDYGLLQRLSVFDNIAAPMYIAHKSKTKIRDSVLSMVEKFQIYDLLKKKVNQLSGGEQQRVAIARAMIQNPQLLLADEPTGSLDEENARQVMKNLHQLHQQRKSIIIVTHNKKIAEQCEKIYYIEDKRLKHHI